MRISNVCARWLMLATLLGTAATANAQISGFEGDGVLNAPYRGTITSLREATMDIPYGEVMNHVEPDLPPPTSYVDWGIVSDIEIWADEPWDRSVLRLYEDCDASGNEINLEGRDANNPAIVELDAPYIIVPDIIKRFSFKAIATKTLSVRTFHVHFRYDKVNLYDTVPPQQADPTRIVRVAPMTGSFTALPGEEEIFHYGTTVLDVSVGSARLTVPIGSTADTIGAAYNYYDRNLGPSAAATSDVVFPGAAESVFIPGDGQFDSENGAYAKWAGFGTPWPGYLIGYHGRPDIYGPDGTHFDVLYSTASLSARHFTYVRPCGLGELRPAAQKYVRDGDYTARIEDQATPNANWIELDRDTPGQVRVDTSDDRHWTILYDDTTKVITGVYPGTNPSTAKGARYFSWRNNSGTIIPLSEGGRVTEVRTEATEGQGILYRFVYDSEGDLREEWRNIDEVLTKTVDHIVIDGTHRRRKEYVAGGCRQTDIAYNATYPSLIESITTHSGDGDSHVTQYVHDVGNLHGNVVIKEVTLPDSSVITHYYDKEVSQPVPSSFAEYGIRTKTVRTRGDSIITRDTEYQFHHSDGWSILLYYRPRLVKKRDGLGNEITYFYEPGGEDGDGTADRSADGLAGEMSNQLWTVLGPQTTTYDTVGTVGQRTAEVNYYYYDDQAGGSPDDRIGLLARKTVKTGVDASSSPTTITTTYDYDALRRITSETVDPTGEALQSEYFYCDTSTTQDRVVRDPDSYVTWTQYDGDGRIAATYCFLDPMTSTITPCTLPTDPYYGTTYTYNDEGWLEYLITDNKDASGTALTPATFTTQFVYDELGRVKQEIVDPGTGGIAQSTNTTYTWQGEIETQTDTFDRGVKRTYDGRGLLKTEMVLGLNKAETPLVTTYEFKLEGGTWVETVTAPTGAVHKKTYDGFGRVAWEERIAGPDGGQTVATWYGYDRASHITRTTVAENGTILSDTTAAYDESGLQYRVRQRLTDGVDNDDTDLMTVRTYDCAGNVIQEAALGDSSVDDPTPDRVIAAHHDTAGRLDEITDGRGGQITFARDGRGNVTEKQVLLDAVASTYAVTTTTYDAFGRATRVRSPADAADVTGLRHYRDFAYNTRGDLLSVTAYETAGADPNPATDTPVRRTQFAYDNVGRRIQEAVMATPASPNDPPDPAEDRVVDLAFFDDGVKDERWTYNIGPGDTLCSLVTKVDYDPLGRVSKTTDPSASFVQNTYDTTNGRLTQRKTNDGVGERTFTLIYDGHDRVKTHKAQGDPIIETKFEYDGLNRRTATIDPENVRTEVHFDLAGRQSELIEDKGGELQRTTTFAYNRLNQLTTQTVENRDSANTPLPDQVTKYAHDSLGRLRGIRYPDSSCPVPDNDCVDCVRLGYDVAGRPATRRDQRGWTTAFAHDPRGLLLSRTTTTPTTVVMDSFAYDAIGQLRDARRGTPVDDDAYALAEMDYTPLGYLEEERQSILTGTVHTVGYEHDPAGNRTELSYSGGGVLTYTATPLNQVDTISLNGSLLADYDYHGDGHRLASRTVTTPSGSYTAAYGYDDHRRTNAIRNTFTAGAAETVLSDYSFTHDTRDNPLERRAGSAGGLPSFMADERTYDVDSLSRLTDTYYAETGTHEHTTLDLVGNREQYTSRDGEQIDYTLANPANQYATIGGANVEYDPAGNLSVDEAGRSYFYDERNRLIEVRAADGTTTLASYTYDALGRRTSFEDPVAGVTTYYYYAGNSVIEEYDDAGNRLRYHVNGGQYIDEQLATVDETSGEATYYLAGEQFSVIGTGNADGSVIEVVGFGPNGDFSGSGACADFDADGDVDADDFAVLEACFSGPDVPVAAGCEDKDLDRDGDVDGMDYVRFQLCMSGEGVAPPPGCEGTPPSGSFALHGRPVDVLSDGLVLMPVRARTYDPRHGRWLQQDPTGYADGPNLYEAFRGNATAFTDPMGTATIDDVDEFVARYLGPEARLRYAMLSHERSIDLALEGNPRTHRRQASRHEIVAGSAVKERRNGSTTYSILWETPGILRLGKDRIAFSLADDPSDVAACLAESIDAHWAAFAKTHEHGTMFELIDIVLPLEEFERAALHGRIGEYGIAGAYAGWGVAKAGAELYGAYRLGKTARRVFVRCVAGDVEDAAVIRVLDRSGESSIIERAAGPIVRSADVVDAGPRGVWSNSGFRVGRHCDMPDPRPAGLQSHHGVLDKWMRERFDRYSAADAPTVLMPNAPSHNATRGVFNRWRAEIAQRQGVSPRELDWLRISRGEVWRLAEEQFNAAGVPRAVREEYWRQFNDYLRTLE